MVFIDYATFSQSQNNAGFSSLFRRLLKDDGRGVAEALNETVCIAADKCEGLTVRV